MAHCFNIMKIFCSLLLVFIFLGASGTSAFGQYRKLTVVLLRHAEKDLTNEDEANPDLSAAGKERAQKLIDAVNKYQPDAIYSTDYERTRATVRPLARKRRALTLVYDERNLAAMKAKILSGEFKRIVVVGHNNTTPALVNALLGAEKYQPLGENEYDKIWIVKIKRNRTKPNQSREKIITY